MPITPKAYAEATSEERREYARTFLNLPVGASDSDDKIASAIQAAQPGVTQIFVQTPDGGDELAASETNPINLLDEEKTGKISGSLGRGDPRAVIHIPVIETEDGSGSRDVVVGVNGRAWQLKRGHDLPVPWRVVEALDNAVASVVRHSMEEGKEGEVIVRDSKRVAFHYVEKPPQGEIDAWMERTGAEFCA